jgi:hypothetical protein
VSCLKLFEKSAHARVFYGRLLGIRRSINCGSEKRSAFRALSVFDRSAGRKLPDLLPDESSRSLDP